MKQIALFDFDGTLSFKDSLSDFIRFAVGPKRFYAGALRLSPVLIGYALGVIPNDRAKMRVIAHFFKNAEAAEFEALANAYAADRLEKILRPAGVARLSWHVSEGHEVVIVSASASSWLKGWTEKRGFDLLATELEVENGRLTGRFATLNCHGEEKVRRIRERYDLSRYERIYAYGDTRGDRPMLSLAHEAYYKPF